MTTQEFYETLNRNYANTISVPKKFVILSKEILKLFPDTPYHLENFKKIPNYEIMSLIERFLKEKYSEEFQTAFFNNLYQSNTKVINGVKKELEEIKYQLKLLKLQKKAHLISSKKYQRQKKGYRFELNILYQVDKSNASCVSPTTGEMILDLRETIEDAFNVLHEGVHKIYTQPKDEEKILPLGEIPSISIEIQFYLFCLEHGYYEEEVLKYMKNRLIPLKESAIRIIMEYFIRTIKENDTLVTKEEIKKCIEQVKDSKIREMLEKELQHNFNFSNGYHVSLWSHFSVYLKAYYVSILINQKEKVSEKNEYLGFHLHDCEKKVLKALKISYKIQSKIPVLASFFAHIYEKQENEETTTSVMQRQKRAS